MLRAPIRMEPGDIFVALSDGVGDAENSNGERFGTARVIDIITRHGGGSAADLMTTLQQVLSEFTAGARADDDRTGVIIKRD